MYNVYEDREFKYSFEDLYSSEVEAIEQRKLDDDRIEKLRTFWNYFEEGK